MPTLRPFRDYDEKDVINLFRLSGAALPVNKGTLVTIVHSGFNSLAEPIQIMDAAYGGFNEPNTVSPRWGVIPCVNVAGTGDTPLGMTLFDVRETDENGLQLKFEPHKAAELEAVLSGQAVPIVTRGLFLYSGITGSPSVNAPLYVGPNGTIDTFQWPTSVAQSGLSTVIPTIQKVGKALGQKDAQGFTLIKLEL